MTVPETLASYAQGAGLGLAWGVLVGASEGYGAAYLVVPVALALLFVGYALENRGADQ